MNRDSKRMGGRDSHHVICARILRLVCPPTQWTTKSLDQSGETVGAFWLALVFEKQTLLLRAQYNAAYNVTVLDKFIMI